MCRYLRLSMLLISFCASSCSHGPRAIPIDIPSEAIQEVVDDSMYDPALAIDMDIPAQWWTLFGDTQLNHFIEVGLERNPTMQSARAKIFAATYRADVARSALFPIFNYGGDLLREKLSETGIIPFNDLGRNVTGASAALPVTGGVAGIPVYFTQYETEVTMRYDFDLWNKRSNTLRAAVGEIYARMADEIFTRLQFSVAIAQVYFRLQVDYRRQELANALVKNQQEVSKLTQLRVTHHLDAQQPVHTSRTNFATAQQLLLQIQADIAIQEYQLKSYLAGHFNEEIEDICIEQQVLPPVPLPRDLPLHLLSRRPDITAQLWLIESAGRLIQVAKAGFYPDFSLTGLFGYQTIKPSRLFEWPSSFFNLNPAFTLPVFDGGRLVASLRGSEIDYDLAIYDYDELVLNAVREVLTGIAVLRNAGDQLAEYEEKFSNQSDLLKLTLLRVQGNLASQLEYLASEQAMLQANDQKILALGATIESILALIKALGGGYEACYGNE